MIYDVAVVGGSSAGLIAARESAKKGLTTIVFEEDGVIGRPELCAGLYSIEGIQSLGIPVNGPYLQNRVRGAVFVSPSGKTFVVDAGGDVAVVFNRERMDLFLAEQASREGVKIKLDTRVIRGASDGKTGTLTTSHETIKARHIIIAEGRRASIAKQMIPNYKIGNWLPIIQYQISRHDFDRQFVYLIFRSYLREFFGYLVPIDDELAKFGVAASKFPDKLASKVMTEFFPKSRVVGVSSSAIYVGEPLKTIRHRNVLLVGDVAGQVKATTGGGVVMGGLAALAAAKHAAGQGVYEQLYRTTYRELKKIYGVRSIYEKLSPRRLDALLTAIAETGFNHVISEVGDMDRHGTSLLKALLSPNTFKLTAAVLKNLIKPDTYV